MLLMKKSSDQDKRDEQSIVEVEEEDEAMTVEQAELMEQYTNEF